MDMPSKKYEEFKNRVYGYLIKYKKDKRGIKAKGRYKGKEYDCVFPEPQYSAELPVMLYEGIVDTVKKIKSSKYAFKPHIFASKHVASSQTACLNLFVPILESKYADEILLASGVVPPDFSKVDRSGFLNGYCFEFWQQISESKKGILGDHSSQAGTDSDVAIAYINKNGKTCIWLIEHKLTEYEFTTCGGYRSDKNTEDGKENCKTASLEQIYADHDKCHYHKNCGFLYWHVMDNPNAKSFFSGKTNVQGCPFRGGMNQLWRNQLVALELERRNIYTEAYFSVVTHPDNTFLDDTMKKYRKLINDSPKFSDFKSSSLVDAAASYLPAWVKWYREVYYGK